MTAILFLDSHQAPFILARVNSETNPKSASEPRWEFASVIFILAVFILVNLVVATRTPTVYADEPQHVDPAANLYFGNGFTSTMWGQDSHEFWCGYVPLYNGILYSFFKIFGFGLFQARALNDLLAAAGGFLIWAALRRTAFVGQPANRLLCLALILSGSVSTLTFRTARPDATMFFVCAAVFFSCCQPASRRWRYLAIVFFSALLPAEGIAMLPYAVLLILINLAVYGLVNLDRLAAVAAGLLAGIAALAEFYHHFSTLQTFVKLFLPNTALGGTGTTFAWREKIFGQFPGGAGIFTSFFGNPLEFLSQQTLFDYSAALLFLLVIFFAAPKMWRGADVRARKFLVFIAAVTLTVPPFMHLTAHFPSYYRWMVFVPLAVAVPHLLEIHASAKHFLLRRLVFFVIGLSIFLGVPARTLAIIPSWTARSTMPIDRVAAQMLRPSDIVICSAKIYFAVRPHARSVYAIGITAGGDFSRTKNLPAQDISLLCLFPADVETVMQTVGGKWEKVPLDKIPEAAALAKTRYAVDFYRREPN